MIKYAYLNLIQIRIVLLSAEVDLPHADEIGKLLVNLIPKSYNEDNKRPF